jgi:hypothetical protein
VRTARPPSMARPVSLMLRAMVVAQVNMSLISRI